MCRSLNRYNVFLGKLRGGWDSTFLSPRRPYVWVPKQKTIAWVRNPHTRLLSWSSQEPLIWWVGDSHFYPPANNRAPRGIVFVEECGKINTFSCIFYVSTWKYRYQADWGKKWYELNLETKYHGMLRTQLQLWTIYKLYKICDLRTEFFTDRASL